MTLWKMWLTNVCDAVSVSFLGLHQLEREEAWRSGHV